jgi:hypothetical protein
MPSDLLQLEIQRLMRIDPVELLGQVPPEMEADLNELSARVAEERAWASFAEGSVVAGAKGIGQKQGIADGQEDPGV